MSAGGAAAGAQWGICPAAATRAGCHRADQPESSCSDSSSGRPAVKSSRLEQGSRTVRCWRFMGEQGLKWGGTNKS